MKKQANKTPKVFSSDQGKLPLEEGHYSVDDVNFTMSEDEQDLALVLERVNEPEISYQTLMETLSANADN